MDSFVIKHHLVLKVLLFYIFFVDMCTYSFNLGYVQSVLWLHYRFSLHNIKLMTNYLCPKEHSNNLWLTKSVTCGLQKTLD